jgi:hypothetical protein
VGLFKRIKVYFCGEKAPGAQNSEEIQQPNTETATDNKINGWIWYFRWDSNSKTAGKGKSKAEPAASSGEASTANDEMKVVIKGNLKSKTTNNGDQTGEQTATNASTLSMSSGTAGLNNLSD